MDPPDDLFRAEALAHRAETTTKRHVIRPLRLPRWIHALAMGVQLGLLGYLLSLPIPTSLRLPAVVMADAAAPDRRELRLAVQTSGGHRDVLRPGTSAQISSTRSPQRSDAAEITGIDELPGSHQPNAERVVLVRARLVSGSSTASPASTTYGDGMAVSLDVPLGTRRGLTVLIDHILRRR